MKLYNRDFNILTEHEMSEWELLKQKEIIHSGKLKVRRSLYYQYPVAVRHYVSLFPNNHLDTILLNDEKILNCKIQSFEDLLNNSLNGEREILNHIQKNEAYFIIGSIFSDYNFGHHDAYVFPEFILGTSYRVDYLLVGRCSGGHEFIFVEFESSQGRVTKKDGEFGEVIKKGISQVCDWDGWIDSNFQSLSETFNSVKNNGMNLPDEFYKLDKSRIHYAVVAGRRSDYKDKTYRLRRKEKEQRKINLLHYDNLVDLSYGLIGENTY